MKKKIIILIAAFTTLAFSGWAQETDPGYRQFFFNPYLYNSAYVGSNERPELSVVYKKQWINFSDAPTTMGLNLQLPTNQRVSLGLNLLSTSHFLLNNTAIKGTFGYLVPIDKKQSLRFGLSGGVGVQRLKFTDEELNTNDPAIINAASRNHYINGDFGMVYTHNKLRVGIALTQLFNANPYEAEEFNKFSLSNLKNRLYSVSYRVDLDPFGNVAVEPYLLYKQSAGGLQDYWEAASIFYFKEHLWTGMSYHEDRGLGLFMGLNHRETFSFSYSYEFPPFKKEGLSYSSHELQMTLKFGKNEKRPNYNKRKR